MFRSIDGGRLFDEWILTFRECLPSSYSGWKTTPILGVADSFRGVATCVARNAQCLICVSCCLGLTQSIVSESEVSLSWMEPVKIVAFRDFLP
jgi:hypothetical protein